jgi:hypothetical protein
MANHSYNPLNWDWSSGKTWGHMAAGLGIGVAATAVAVFASPIVTSAVCSALGIGASGFVGGAIGGAIGGMIGGFINGAGFTALDGGNFNQSMKGGLSGAAIGGVSGVVLGGAFQGIKALTKGDNFWSGDAVAQGRNAFSFKNTPVNTNPAPATEPIPINNTGVDVPQPSAPSSLSTPNNTGDGIPSDWTQNPSNKGGGVIYQDPNNPHNSIRFMPGNPNSPNPAQQNPYVIYRQNGIPYDVNGLPLPNAKLPDAHIPQSLFNINKMPGFK